MVELMLRIILIVLLVLFVICCIIVAVDSNRFVVREYTIKSDKIKEPADFLFITDLHCKEYGRNNEKLFKAIDSIKADYALIGGDIMVAKRGRRQDRGIKFVNGLSSKMPVYFAFGNHEQRSKLHPDVYGDMFLKFTNAVFNDNVHFLNNETVTVNGINITGFSMEEKFYVRRNRLKMTQKDIYSKTGEMSEDTFNILLAHDPEYFDAYSEIGASLVLSGHFHGGIGRLPFLGGMISPRFVLFPEYSGGEYEKNGTTMIVSCGMGMHSLPFRFNNPAELSVVHLKKD